MSQALVARPFSPHCEQVPIALYETGTPFTMRLLAHEKAGRWANAGRRGHGVGSRASLTASKVLWDRD